ncbi:MBG domain-containing protein [Clostridiales Family XIII bacterium ASD5510]|uniref:MBG domain-containing protein n=1 Tax=Hominibacterium faecale TaxID=2839743 RepID=A0A9J6QKS0_9FIRM|nr:MBG domain-containing protein [Hominibacterium faecale]MCU7377737.1 MBG domain-containing protein [Hominibacterium faecale]
MKGKKRKTAVLTMAAVLSVMMIASPLAVMAEETASAAPAITQDGNVQKETAPAIRLPENLRAKAGTALKDVALPEPWTWADGSTVIPAETAEYPARLCVDDTAYDYSKVEGYNAGGHYVERMVVVTAEAAKAEAAGPVQGKSRGLPGDTPVTYDAGDIKIDDGTNFPDAEFRKYIGNFDQDGNSKLSAAEIADIKKVDVHGNTGIRNLKGIEHFTALETLNCYETGIGSLDVSNNKKLTYLDCGDNVSLTDLTVDGAAALETLYCYKTGIGSLDVSSNKKLTDLACSNNASLASLTVDGAEDLETLNCGNTKLGSLDVSNNKKLTYLACSNNASLTSLTVDGAEDLETLYCGNTKLGSLDVSNNQALKALYCYETGIGSLDVSNNKKLTYLDCSNNASLTSLTVDGAEDLGTLNCGNTKLGSLDVSRNPNLVHLYCDNNPLAYLKIGTNNKLTNVHSTGLKPVEVTVTSDHFQMADKFAGIDPNAVEGVSGATYNSGTMSNYREGTPITYTYHCGTSSGGEVTIGVTLNITLGSTIFITENLNKTYDGKAVSAAPQVSTEGSSGAVSFTWERENGANTWEIINSAPTDAGTYQVTAALESDGTYKEATSEPVRFTISPKDITTDSQIIVPDITADTDLDKLVIQDGDRVLVQGTDYDVTKTQDGAKVTVAITGKGNYTGTITRTYTVNGPDSNKDGTKTAQTGDPANVGLLAAMVLLSAGCMFVLIRKKGQKK